MVTKAATKIVEAPDLEVKSSDTVMTQVVDIRDISGDAELAKPFSADVLKRLSKGGQSFDYVPVSEVIARLNFVLGTDGWEEVSSVVKRDAEDPDWVIAHVVLAKRTLYGDKVTKHGYGGAAVKRKKDGGILDLGDDFKGAHSDAFKKAATQLGVGLDIARSEDALQAEQDERQRIEDGKQPLADEESLKSITVAIAALDDAQKLELKKFWTENVPHKLDSGKLTTAHVAKILEHLNG